MSYDLHEANHKLSMNEVFGHFLKLGVSDGLQQQWCVSHANHFSVFDVTGVAQAFMLQLITAH